MTDKNGKEIRTGNVVEISGAFFKNDNGRFIVQRSPDDDVPNYGRRENYTLRKLNKNGTIKKGRYNLIFWPLSVCVNSFKLGSDARKHNAENAKIEIINEGGK